MRRTRWQQWWLVTLLAAVMVMAAGCADIDVGPDNGDDDDDARLQPGPNVAEVAGAPACPTGLCPRRATP